MKSTPLFCSMSAILLAILSLGCEPQFVCVVDPDNQTSCIPGQHVVTTYFLKPESFTCGDVKQELLTSNKAEDMFLNQVGLTLTCKQQDVDCTCTIEGKPGDSAKPKQSKNAHLTTVLNREPAWTEPGMRTFVVDGKRRVPFEVEVAKTVSPAVYKLTVNNASDLIDSIATSLSISVKFRGQLAIQNPELHQEY